MMIYKELIIKKLIYQTNSSYYCILESEEGYFLKGKLYHNFKSLIGVKLQFYGFEKYDKNYKNKVFIFTQYSFIQPTLFFLKEYVKLKQNQIDEYIEILKHYCSEYEYDEMFKKAIEHEKAIFEKNTAPDSFPRLKRVKGLGTKKLKNIINKWNEFKNINSLMNILLDFGFSLVNIKDIVDYFYYIDELEEYILENPYELLQIPNIGFERIDRMARSICNAKIDDTSRLLEGIKYCTKKIMYSSGSTMVTIKESFNFSMKELSYNEFLLNFDTFTSIIKENPEHFNLNKDGTYITIKSIFNMERKVLLDIENALKLEKNSELVSHTKIDKWIQEKEFLYSLTLSKTQKDAIYMFNSGIRIFSLSGYAGTGKTTISKILMDLYSEKNKTIHCCALSGVASNKIRINTGYQSSTIHSLLGYDGNKFLYNKQNKLKYDLIVLDEVGMVSVDIFMNLINAIDFNHTSLILIGDPAQLPPVGIGNVYQNLLDYNIVPNITLKDIYRTANGSEINFVAESIRNGKFSEKHKTSLNGFYPYFFDEETNLHEKFIKIATSIMEISNGIIKNGFNEDNLLELQVISPMKNGDLGTKKLNDILQETLNSSTKKEILVIDGQCNFKQGDKVIHLKNTTTDVRKSQYQDIVREKVNNGQIGYVVSIDKKEFKVTVHYPYEDQFVVYTKNYLLDGFLDLAYALTAHKVQGNEFTNLVTIVTKEHFNMLDSNYLYSAVTRGKENDYIIGDFNIIQNAVKSTSHNKRVTIIQKIKEDDVMSNIDFIEYFDDNKKHLDFESN